MHSYRVNVENPWNLFAADENLPKTPSFNKFSNVSFTNSTQNFEKFLSNKVPVSFSGKQNVICCKICDILVVKNRYKEHYDSRHNLSGSKNDMIPFEDEILHSDKIYKSKKIKRSKKKRPNIKDKLDSSTELINKKKGKKIKVKSPSKRLHSKSLFDDIEFVLEKKKLKSSSDYIMETLADKKNHFGSRTEEDFLSSPKPMDEGFYQEKMIASKSYNPLSINDGLCYSNDSVHRTSSDSSTPPSLSLGTLQTLSSPSSLNILNDLSSVITEHYLLPSNDLTAERSGISCKYQIDSLPWENLPSVSSKIFNSGSLYSKDKESFSEITLNEEDGEIERAVQSITGFYECLADDFDISNQTSFDLPGEGCKSIVAKPENESTDENNLEMKSDMFTSDDATVIDCFLDEISGHSNDKDPLSDNGIGGGTGNGNINTDLSQNVVDMFMADCNSLSEYPIDANLLNIFNADYEEKFETLINNTMNEFVSQSPQSISIELAKYDRKKSGGKVIQQRSFDPLKHCGVIGTNGQFCHRSLLCKLHTMPQKRQVERSENITSLIKGIRDSNKIKKMNKKAAYTSNDSRSSCSKMSCDSFLYNCSSNKSTEEMPSLLEKNVAANGDMDSSSGYNCSINLNVCNSSAPSSHESPQPLVIPRFDKEVIVNGNRPLLAMKSLVWRNRPKAQCDPDLLGRFLSNQDNYGPHYTSVKQTESTFQDIMTGEVFSSQPLDSGTNVTSVSSKAVPTIVTTKDLVLDHFCGNYENGSTCFDDNYPCNSNSKSIDFPISAAVVPGVKVHQMGSRTPSNFFNDSSNIISSTNNFAQFNGSNMISFSRESMTSNSGFLTTADASPNNSGNSISVNNNLNGLPAQKSQIASPGGSFGGCSNRMLNVSSQHSNGMDVNLIESSNNGAISFADQNSSIINNTSNQNNTSIWNPVLSDSVFSSSSKFISITDDRSGAAQMLYPVRSSGQIMMVMNKNTKLLNDSVDLTAENLSFSLNQSIPISSLLTLKQQNDNPLSSNSQRNSSIHQQHQSTTVPTQQIVSISPLELQRLADGLCNSSNQIINNDCVNKSSDQIFIGHSGKGTEKRNQILYQLNQNQSTGQFVSSALPSKIDSSNLPKPLTVQSSTPNGITHRFVILPDGTISAFTQQSSNLKPSIAQQQIINRTALQHPLFGQISNCTQNQGCFLNGDKLIIAPSQVTSNALPQQIIMPQIINQAELNNQSNSRFTLVQQQQQQQQKLGGSSTPKSGYDSRPSQSSSNVSNQVSLDSSHQKLSFQIQASPNQYQTHTPNTYFLTAAPSGNSNMPVKQQIFLQSNDQIATDFSSLIDSNKFVDTQYNAQKKPIHHFENLQCNSDVRTINSTNQDFDFLNHVINSQSIIIQQQPPVNRVATQSLSQLSNSNVVQNQFVSQTSQDINSSSSIDGAHSNVSNGGSNNNNNSNSNNNNQHIFINNCSNKQFAQSQLTLSQRQLSTSFSNASNCSSVVVNQNPSSNFKTVPPPLVISQQLLNQTVSSQFGNKSFIDIPYHQQSQQKNSHINQVSLDENQFSNEFVIMQSMIA